MKRFSSQMFLFVFVFVFQGLLNGYTITVVNETNYDVECVNLCDSSGQQKTAIPAKKNSSFTSGCKTNKVEVQALVKDFFKEPVKKDLQATLTLFLDEKTPNQTIPVAVRFDEKNKTLMLLKL